jgi:pyruvate dehydrogenase E2 component (dihydrolipoamide acetyltransferase)
MSEYRMPSLGADMEAGTLVEWLVKPGQAVARGDIVAVVETQKGAIEIEIFEAGVIEKFLAEPGDTVPVGMPLALIRTAGDSKPPSPEPAAPLASSKPPSPVTAAAMPAGETEEHIRASPAARRLAAERGLNLGQLTGTGPGGAIQLVDVEAFAKAPAVGPAPFDFSQMRAAIGAAMSRSKREIPHYYLSDTVELGAASRWLTQRNTEQPPESRLLMGALFVKATALAARKHPEFNGRFEDGAFHPAAAIHVGVAVALRGGGLVAPAIHDTADLELGALMGRMRDLVGRVRAGRFRSSEVADPTITVSSLGDRGVEALYGVIYAPQVAIVGFGRMVERPWVVDNAVVPRPVVTVTLAADHRVSDGHRGALFLNEIGRLLQNPEAL